MAQSRRALTFSTIACLIIALATLGGYRLAGSLGSAPGHVRLANTTTTETWVSFYGSDSNATSFCSRPNPCRTLGAALGVTDAFPGGEIDTLDTGPFGPLNSSTQTLNQSVTIDGNGGGGNARILSSADGITINAGATDVVVLRHLRIFGSLGNVGIRFTSGRALVLNDVEIEGFNDGVTASLTAAGSTITMINCHIHDNFSAGVAVSTSTGRVHVNISHSTIENNAYGIINGDGAVLDLSNSVITGNSTIGLGAQTYGTLPSLVHAAHNQFDNNPYAIWETHGAGNAQIIIWLTDNDVVNNTYGIYGNPGGTLAVFSFGNNRLAGNSVPGGVNGVASQT